MGIAGLGVIVLVGLAVLGLIIAGVVALVNNPRDREK